jgi:hypothetical protein
LQELKNLHCHLAPEVEDKLTSGIEMEDDILTLLPWDNISYVRFEIFILSGKNLHFYSINKIK